MLGKGILVMHTSFVLGSLGEERSLLSIFSSQPLFTRRRVLPEGKLLCKNFVSWKETVFLTVLIQPCR